MRKKSILTLFSSYTVLLIFAFLTISPFLWLVSTSFDQINTYSLPYPPRLFPQNFSLFNYQMALLNMPIFKYLANTIILVIFACLFSVLISTMVGFCFSKGKFIGKNLLILLVLSNMMVPFQAKLIPIYNIVRGLGFADSFVGVLLPSIMTHGMYIFFVKQFCDDLPTDLYEAGTVDGANKFRIYYRIFLPLMGPIMATIVILEAINVWNDLLWPMIIITDQSLSTIQMGLVRYTTGADGVVHAGMSIAMSILSIVPLGIVFCFMQRYIVQSVASTGLKQ